jgi:hypothetical protein
VLLSGENQEHFAWAFQEKVQGENSNVPHWNCSLWQHFLLAGISQLHE